MTDLWEWPQYTMIIWWFLVLLLHAVKHGEQRRDKYSYPLVTLNVLFMAFLLAEGGFFGGVK